MTQPTPILMLELVEGDVPPFSRSFSSAVRIGRGAECDLRLDASQVSRTHAELLPRGGVWWIRDLKSTNGTFLNGEKVDEAPITGECRLQLGRKGPLLKVTLSGGAATTDSAAARASVATTPYGPTSIGTRPAQGPSEGAATPGRAGHGRPADRATPGRAGQGHPAGPTRAEPAAGPSIDHYIQHYLKTADDTDAGEHTIMIRRAFATVQKKQRRHYVGVIAAVVALAVVLGGWAVMNQLKIGRQQKAAAALFYQMKDLDLQISQIRMVLENSENAQLSDQIDRLEKSRAQMSRRYDGYLKDLGVYRKLNDNEKLIYRMARVFNESEFGMPAEFADSVLYMIRNYWQTPAGRSRFVQSLKEADDNGYTSFIVRVMRRNGLPPQFFYMALQESNLNEHAIGPETRWGRAKGMWQFIPTTATRYGLDPGPYANEKMIDPRDERLDFQKETKAAARYLQDVYSTLAQASGLLVVASYNWGEHRIVNKLESLPGPQTIPAEALAGIPEDPSSRNYWTFLGQYRDRMPQETKDYVLKIFSAAVIGENPRQFGFDMDNPLKPYLEAGDSFNVQ